MWAIDHTRRIMAEASALQQFELSIFQDHRGKTIFFRLLCHVVTSICVCTQFQYQQLSVERIFPYIVRSFMYKWFFVLSSARCSNLKQSCINCPMLRWQNAESVDLMQHQPMFILNSEPWLYSVPPEINKAGGKSSSQGSWQFPGNTIKRNGTCT